MYIEITVKDGITIIDTKNTFDYSAVSGYPGVVFIEKTSRYRSQIYREKKCFYLGTFDTAEEAYSMRKKAEEKWENGTFHEWFQTLSKDYKHKPCKYRK